MIIRDYVDKAFCRISPVVTVGRRDAAGECTGMYSQRVTEGFIRQKAFTALR
jgi:hypothetical protein